MIVEKRGNGLAIRLPKDLVTDLGLEAGDELEIVQATRDRLAASRRERKEDALRRMAERRWEVPPDYEFDREEANKR